MAVGTLAMGMVFIAGTFLVAIHLTTVSSERSIAVVVAEEAFAKVRIFGIDPNDPNLLDDGQIPFELLNPVAVNEFSYPSTRTIAYKQYFWSALCRREASVPNRVVQVTVFVSRKIGAGSTYEGPWVDRPVAMLVGVTGLAGDVVLTIEPGKERWINGGYTIVEDETGEIYRVIERGADGAPPDQITLDPATPWMGGTQVWVVPPAIIGSSRGPCIAVYQTKIPF